MKNIKNKMQIKQKKTESIDSVNVQDLKPINGEKIDFRCRLAGDSV
jgi:hypothetical protein